MLITFWANCSAGLSIQVMSMQERELSFWNSAIEAATAEHCPRFVASTYSGLILGLFFTGTVSERFAQCQCWNVACTGQLDGH